MSVYLHLFHGRTTATQDMDSWGSEGPTIGPLTYVHTTYGTEVKIRGSREVLENFFPHTEIHFHDGYGELAIQLDGDCLPYAGKVYGDWSVCTADALRTRGSPDRKPVCDICGSDDLVKDAAAVWDREAQDWSLSSTYDSTTCQTCLREGDDMEHWVDAGQPVPTRPIDAVPAGDAA